MKYDHKTVEKKWQKYWREHKVNKTNEHNHGKEKFFMLDMLPYPSGDGLHMGHTESYTASDIMYRYKRMQGYNVLHNQAFDSFGLPAENYAIKTGIHPSETVRTAGENFITQMQSLGFGYDYDDIFWTSDPGYYKWTQWLFARFFENNLVYKDTQIVNWCPSCHTTLANEQVEQGLCERCGSEVIQKEIPGWYFRITDFADDLIHGDDSQNDWPEHTKKNQNEWIGKSEGAKISFKVQDTDYEIEVFTTRPDTLYGATYMVLAPEHDLVNNKLGSLITNWDEVQTYVHNTHKKSELERLENRDKTGVQLKGVSAINPANGEQIPVFIADYVLAGYGTGAIMAVPAHDDRDYEFATKFDLPIRQVVAQIGTEYIKKEAKTSRRDGAYLIIENDTGDILIQHNSVYGRSQLPGGGINDGESPKDCAVRETAEEAGYDDVVLTEWSIQTWFHHYNFKSDKNYEGIKYVYGATLKSESFAETSWEDDEDLTHKWMSKDELRSVLRGDDFRAGDREAVLAYLADEPFTGDGIVVNSGEFDGMTSADAKQAITEKVGGEMTATYRLKDWSISRQRYWGAPIPIVYDPEDKAHLVPDEHLPWVLPTDVDFVPRGTAPLAESKELFDRTESIFGKGWIPETDTMDTFVCSSWYYLRYADPQNNEEWCSEENRKYWQPVDLYIGGAEHTYMHLLYARFWIKAMKSMGMLDYDEPFLKLRHQGYVLDAAGKKMSKSKGNVVNPNEMVERFGADATRMYMMFAGPLEDEVMWNENGVVGMYRFLEKVLRVQEKIGETSSNEIKQITHKTIKKVSEDIDDLRFNTAISALMVCTNAMDKADSVGSQEYQAVVTLLSVFAPHFCQEVMHQITNEEAYISDYAWPEYDETMLVEDTIELGVQINGKTRGTVQVAPNASEDEVVAAAQDTDSIKRWIEAGEIARVIYVPGKICNLIVQ